MTMLCCFQSLWTAKPTSTKQDLHICESGINLTAAKELASLAGDGVYSQTSKLEKI